MQLPPLSKSFRRVLVRGLCVPRASGAQRGAQPRCWEALHSVLGLPAQPEC